MLTSASGTRSSDVGSGAESSEGGVERPSSSEEGSSPRSVSSHDIFVHQSVIYMPGFRSLAEEEEVEVEYKITDKGNPEDVAGKFWSWVCGLNGRGVPTSN